MRLMTLALIVILAYILRDFLYEMAGLPPAANYLSWSNAIAVSSFLGIAFVLHAAVDLARRCTRARLTRSLIE